MLAYDGSGYVDLSKIKYIDKEGTNNPKEMKVTYWFDDLSTIERIVDVNMFHHNIFMAD